MTVQEAYNKGLDVAETEALDKLTKALDGLDVTPFTNPNMEQLRQRLLNLKEGGTSFVLEFFEKNLIDESLLSSTEIKILDLLKFCKRIIPKRPTSKISVGLRDKIRSIEVELVKTSKKDT